MHGTKTSNPDAIAVVTPSDQFIGNAEIFSSVIKEFLAFTENIRH